MLQSISIKTTAIKVLLRIVLLNWRLQQQTQKFGYKLIWLKSINEFSICLQLMKFDWFPVINPNWINEIRQMEFIRLISQIKFAEFTGTIMADWLLKFVFRISLICLNSIAGASNLISGNLIQEIQNKLKSAIKSVYYRHGMHSLIRIRLSWLACWFVWLITSGLVLISD